MTDQSSRNKASPRRSRLVRVFGVFAIFSSLLTVAAPWIIAQTDLSDWLINRMIGTPNLSASSHRASCGWFSPLAIEDVEINGKLHHFRVEMKSVTADRSWPRLLASSPHSGTISIEQPHVYLHLPIGESGERSTILSPTFTAAVNDASLTVYRPGFENSVIDVNAIDMTLRVRQTDKGRALTLDPLDVFTKRAITPKLCSSLLHVLIPSLRNAAKVEGKFSLSLGHLRSPIGVPSEQLVDRIEVEGARSDSSMRWSTSRKLRKCLARRRRPMPQSESRSANNDPAILLRSGRKPEPEKPSDEASTATSPKTDDDPPASETYSSLLTRLAERSIAKMSRESGCVRQAENY